MNTEPEFSTTEVARFCKVAPRTVVKWCDTSRLKYERHEHPKGRRIKRSDLIGFLKLHGMPIDGI